MLCSNLMPVTLSVHVASDVKAFAIVLDIEVSFTSGVFSTLLFLEDVAI